MKKAVSMFLTAALAVSCLAGCGSSAGNTSTGNASAGADSSASDDSAADDSAADGSVFKIGSIGPTTGCSNLRKRSYERSTDGSG